MTLRIRATFWRLLLALGLAAIPLPLAAAEQGTPLQVEVLPLQDQVAVGTIARFRIILRDALGNAVPAAQPTGIEVTLSQGTATQTRTVVVPAGATEATTSFTVTAPGLTTIQTSNPRLMAGSGAVFALTGAFRSGTLRPEALPGGDALAAIADRSPPLVSALPTAPETHDEVIVNVPEQEILADGKQAYPVQVYLASGRAATADVSVLLSTTKGRIEPNPVVIARGQAMVSAKWISAAGVTGEATLRIISTSPPLRKGDPVTRSFAPPIHSVRLRSDPPAISLLDRGTFIAELHDDVNNVTVAADHDIALTLSVVDGTGDGRMRPPDVVFRKGSATARVDFLPKAQGRVLVAGQIPNRPPGEAVIIIGFGIAALVTAGLGGSLGGGIASVTKGRRGRRSEDAAPEDAAETEEAPGARSFSSASSPARSAGSASFSPSSSSGLRPTSTGRAISTS